MAHQVLARKWRPRSFDTLVGQDHVVKALSHALETGRLHHAYLFTGTRGVGKTTIARILAKAVNCEAQITATPCGQCSACTQIDAGGFVDYLELDAASNRGVDEMVQILDNAVYAPTAGRYKVYVIDEVHMLTTHAFNAMLKTLEEPPEHVLFILATTDPQKVPVTVLSRCMQFNLRNMRADAIAGHLAAVLKEESIDANEEALRLIGKGAAGSMRDALSLTDQAIAGGAGQVDLEQVREMLGMIDSQYVDRILQALGQRDTAALVALADEISGLNGPAERLLSDLAERLAQMASEQATGSDAHAGFSVQDLQVFYQVAVHGQKDLPLAPDVGSGLVMTFLRMAAFVTDEVAAAQAPPSETPLQPGMSPADAARAALAGNRKKKSAAPVGSAPVASAPVAAAPSPSASPNARAPLVGHKAAQVDAPVRSRAPAPSPSSALPPDRGSDNGPDIGPEPPSPGDDQQAPDGNQSATDSQAVANEFDGDWPALAAHCQLKGMSGQFMTQSELVSHQRDNNQIQIHLKVPNSALADSSRIRRVEQDLARFIGPVKIQVSVGQVSGKTAASVADEARSERLSQARASLESDPFVQTLQKDFQATIVPDSVRPADASSNHGEHNA